MQATGEGAAGGLLLNALLELGRHGDPEERLAACLALENLAAGSPAASKALLSAGAHAMVSSLQLCTIVLFIVALLRCPVTVKHDVGSCL